jgi:prephenate dehydrogenase
MVNEMEDGFRLQDSRIAIIGLGLMGGSLALALKGKCAALYGIDSDPATLELALANGIVDQAEGDPAKLLPQADLLILATPVLAIIDVLQRLPSFVQKPCIVLDLGSTKRDIVRAMEALPKRFDPIGGHPICGKEKLGLEHAEAGLFQNSVFVVTPLARSTDRARQAAGQLISALGAHRIDMAAEEHDQALAFTSHLPFLLSSALALSTPSVFSSFIGTGFRSTSRLAGTPSQMMMDVLKTNREHVIHSIENFRQSLDQIETALKNENDTQLELLLNQSRSTYQSLISNLQPPISNLQSLISNL